MTREEASFILMLAKNRVRDDELNEALDMAIEALEQELCEECVSREQLKREIHFYNARLLDDIEIIDKYKAKVRTRNDKRNNEKT